MIGISTKQDTSENFFGRAPSKAMPATTSLASDSLDSLSPDPCPDPIHE